MIMGDDDKRWYRKLFRKNAETFLKDKRPLLAPRTRYIENRGHLSASRVEAKAAELGTDSYMGMHAHHPNVQCLGCAVQLCTEAKHRKKTDCLLMEPDDTDAKKGKRSRKNETSTAGGGSIRGHMAGSEKRRIKKAAKSFGGGQPV